MTIRHDFDFIKSRYLDLYNKGILRGSHTLDFHLEDWKATLSDVQFKLYSDIKSIGTFLYPLYPIGDYFIDFGNPFEKVGIELLYKEYERQERLDCIEYFKKEGWTVYSLESKYVAFSAEDLYNRVYKDEDFPPDSQKWAQFIDEYKDRNSECLVYFIKQNYFKVNESDDYNYSDEDI